MYAHPLINSIVWHSESTGVLSFTESPAETLAKLECQSYNTSKDYYVRFYDKRELPKRFHYANNRRIDDVVMELEDKWRVFT